LPALAGPHQVDNAGNAIAAIRALDDSRISEESVAAGMKNVAWPARMQNLGAGQLRSYVSKDTEIWLDGGHNAPAGPMVAAAMRELGLRVPKPLVLIWGMLNTKSPSGFIANFKRLADAVVTLPIPEEVNTIPATELAAAAMHEGLKSVAATTLQDALEQACKLYPAPRILICGSLYLAGHVLALHSGEEASAVSGAAKR
jgi:dihydrofolate synthase/folylpolyglutamate synthase